MSILSFDDWRDAIESDAWAWPDFKPSEMACRGTGKLKIDTEAMDKLQELRTFLGKPILVTSAYRSPEHNRAVGGAKKSQHLLGRAFDCMMTNHDPAAFEAAARHVGFTGFGFYEKHNFIHIDIGPEREWGKRWYAPEFDPEPKPNLAEGTATAGGVVAGAGAVLTTVTENADAVLEQATDPMLQKALEAFPTIAGIVGGVALVALVLRFFLKKREEKAE